MALNFNSFSLASVILLGMTALILLVSHEWRLSISALSVMYIGVFILVALSWPLELAVVKLVAGWISTSVLGMALLNTESRAYRSGRYMPSEIVFRISASSLVVLVAISLASGIKNWQPTFSYNQILGGVVLIGMGLLHLGFALDPLGVVIGLLTFYAGFEIIYAMIESSVLVIGFLALINMGMALLGAYLLLAPTMDVEK